MSEAEQREIENSARKYVADLWELSENAVNLKCTPVKDHYEGYIAGATTMAEKRIEDVQTIMRAMEQQGIELERVKAVAEKMVKVIKLISETDHVHLASEARDGREVLTEFANLMNKEK